MKIIRKFLCVLLCLFMLSGCVTSKKYVAYTIYPIQYLLERIGGNKIETISIQNNSIVQTANIVENYEEILKNSMYFFHIGNIEPYLDLYSDEIENTGVNDIDLSYLNAVYKYKRYNVVYSEDGDSTWYESSYYNDAIFDEIDTYDYDLFLWLNPICMLSMAESVYSTLSSNYVEQSDYFKANFETLENELVTLDANYHKLAVTLKKNDVTLKFVSMTGSFGSWQKAYGFRVYPICLSKYGALPNDAQLALIKERIIQDDVKFIVYEPNMSDEMSALYQELETELGLKRVNLSNISSLTVTQNNDGKNYLSLMNDNYAVLQSMADDLIGK